METRWLLVLPAVICLGMLACSSPALCQEDYTGAKVAVEQYVAKYAKHPAGIMAIQTSFDIEDIENLKNATVLDPFTVMRIDKNDILAASNGEELVSKSKVMKIVYPIFAENKVIGYVYVRKDDNNDLGWRAIGGRKNTLGDVYYDIYTLNIRNAENEYHELQVAIDAYWGYILEKDAGGYNLIPFQKGAAGILGIEYEPDGSRNKIPLERALVIMKKRSAECIKRKEDNTE